MKQVSKFKNIKGFLIVIILFFVVIIVDSLIYRNKNVTNNDYRCYDLSGQNIKKVVINIENSNLKLEALDWDEHAYMYSGSNFDDFFDANINDGCLYIKNKDNINLDTDNKYEIHFVLPIYFDNDVDFDINIVNGDLIISGVVNMDNILCKVINSDIRGDYIIAKKINLSVDKNHVIELANKIETEYSGRHLINKK